jgi:hypothetical protein
MTDIAKTSTAIMAKQRVAVSHVPGVVTLHIGNTDIPMEYRCALEVSAWLGMHGREAKREVGDNSREFRVMGVLSDLEQEELAAQKRRWA